MFTKHESRFAQSILLALAFFIPSLFITPSLAAADDDETKPSCSLSLGQLFPLLNV
ncbi:hypothetical protein ACSS6N_24770 [Peribacillus frigoritolerans]|uniref:hypothetical protein n=1 Tax=Peribacillus frigoritolerans TaxID=450367 RepID=UPI003F86728F